jgi:hypothetical protein
MSFHIRHFCCLQTGQVGTFDRIVPGWKYQGKWMLGVRLIPIMYNSMYLARYLVDRLLRYHPSPLDPR